MFAQTFFNPKKIALLGYVLIDVNFLNTSVLAIISPYIMHGFVGGIIRDLSISFYIKNWIPACAGKNWQEGQFLTML
jgi:hypothetical protein